jgi:Subtilase family
VFEHLKDIRPWGPSDRLTADAIQDWQERLEAAPQRPVRFETEFWFRDNEERRRRTEHSFEAMLGGLGGQIIHQAAIVPIRYHAALAEVPASEIRTILDHPDVGLVAVDDIMVLRPQSVIGDLDPRDEEEAEAGSPAAASRPMRPPVVALFDGLPMALHDRLRDRLEIDDPDDFAAAYGAASEQLHGTAMASLIVHGNLDEVPTPISHRLYVRPVTIPQEVLPGERRELMPADQLGIDLMWRAFLRMLAGEDGDAPVAPTVKIVNLSLGDAKRRFAGVMSPWAKLIDYVAWRYKTLVLISAGNIYDGLPLPGLETWQAFEASAPADRQAVVLQNVLQNRATRRLLSPSEAVNALTIGACHSDSAPENGAGAMAAGPYESGFLPNLSSAMGLGFRRGIKPELLFPGGREQVRANSTRAPIEVRPVGSPNRYFGIRAARPGSAGLTNETALYSGTSVAAALAAHDAARIIEALEELPPEEIHPRHKRLHDDAQKIIIDRVAGRKVGDDGSNLLDNTGAFMAANHWIGQVREIAVAGMQVGVAHAAGHDPHKHFAGERRREVERLDLERSRPDRHHCSGDLHMDAPQASRRSVLLAPLWAGRPQLPRFGRCRIAARRSLEGRDSLLSVAANGSVEAYSLARL